MVAGLFHKGSNLSIIKNTSHGTPLPITRDLEGPESGIFEFE